MKEKLRILEDRPRPDKLPIDEIPEYKEESWKDTEKLLKDGLREKQRALNEARCQVPTADKVIMSMRTSAKPLLLLKKYIKKK